MMTPFPPKSVLRMRLDAEQRGKPQPRRQPKPKPPVPLDSSKRPKMASEGEGVVDATIDWLAHIRHGRIQVR